MNKKGSIASKMTDHRQIQMGHEDRRITNPEIIKAILSRNIVCTVAMQDEPYPYIVPMNYGYVWEKELILYMHMANKGHRLDLLEKNPCVSCNVNMFLDRFGKKRYRKEGHDYRSVTVFGKAELISNKEPEEFLKGLNALSRNAGHTLLRRVPANKNLLVLKVTADVITAKAQYPIKDLEEAAMPPPDWEAGEGHL